MVGRRFYSHPSPWFLPKLKDRSLRFLPTRTVECHDIKKVESEGPCDPSVWSDLKGLNPDLYLDSLSFRLWTYLPLVLSLSFVSKSFLLFRSSVLITPSVPDLSRRVYLQGSRGRSLDTRPSILTLPNPKPNQKLVQRGVRCEIYDQMEMIHPTYDYKGLEIRENKVKIQ